jgi:hypothetical protein
VVERPDLLHRLGPVSLESQPAIVYVDRRRRLVLAHLVDLDVVPGQPSLDRRPSPGGLAAGRIDHDLVIHPQLVDRLLDAGDRGIGDHHLAVPPAHVGMDDAVEIQTDRLCHLFVLLLYLRV